MAEHIEFDLTIWKDDLLWRYKLEEKTLKRDDGGAVGTLSECLDGSSPDPATVVDLAFADLRRKVALVTL